MGAGLALSISTRYPEVYASYRQEFNAGKLRLGNIIPVTTSDGKYTVLNCLTQRFIGTYTRQLNYEALAGVLDKINQTYPEETIAFPQIGCGLAGGNWAVVEKMIDQLLVKAKAIIYIL